VRGANIREDQGDSDIAVQHRHSYAFVVAFTAAARARGGAGRAVARAVRINPNAKVMSAAPLHPAFTTLVQSAAFVRWKSSAFDEKRVAGRFRTGGTQDAFRQKWSYDVTLSAPIVLDPAAKTVPRKQARRASPRRSGCLALS
jgi:hypothetical protein